LKGDFAQSLRSIYNMEMFLMEKYGMSPSEMNNMVLMDFEFYYDRAVSESESQPSDDFGEMEQIENMNSIKPMQIGKAFDGI